MVSDGVSVAMLELDEVDELDEVPAAASVLVLLPQAEALSATAARATVMAMRGFMSAISLWCGAPSGLRARRGWRRGARLGAAHLVLGGCCWSGAASGVLR